MIGPADLRRAIARFGPVVVAMIVRADGSTPRETGCAMLIHRGGIDGTIGGGALEHDVMDIAHSMVATGEDHRRIERALGPEIDQCCGGRVEIFLCRFGQADLSDHTAKVIPLGPGVPDLRPQPAPRPVIIYGAGHVGRALAHALTPLPFSLTLTDSRAEMAADDVDLSPLPEALAKAADPATFHLVVTHSHALDLEIVAAVLCRTHAFCGLIGSATKREVFTRRLRERGLRDAQIDALTCPIGLPGLRDKRPEVIAASVAAQLLQWDAALSGTASTP